MQRRISRSLPISPFLVLLISACNSGGGGSGGNPNTPPPPPPPQGPTPEVEISIADAAATEGDAVITFIVSLDEAATTAVTVDYATEDDTATAGEDYVAASGTLQVPAGSTSASIDVDLLDDAAVEGDERLTVVLTSPSSNATLTAAVATGTIGDDDAAPPPAFETRILNDTGVVDCSTLSASGLPCNDAASGTEAFAHQDAEFGRDATVRDDTDGWAGFAFTKLDAAGTPLADQEADYATEPWRCVRDETTGLVWEIRSDDDGVQDRDWTYTWHEPDSLAAADDSGSPDGGTCFAGDACDTGAYRAAINALELCGFDDWRLPKRRELLSIMHFGAAGPLIDTSYFPHTVVLPYWSSTVQPLGGPTYVRFDQGGSSAAVSDEPLAVRLVRGEDSP